MLEILKQTWQEFSEDKCTRIAAALAYSTAFSLAPMLVLIISVCQIVFEPEDVRGRVEAEIAGVVGQEGAEQVKTMVDSTGSRAEQGVLATVVGVVVVLIGATGFFAQLQAGMNDVWEVQPSPDRSSFTHFVVKRLVSLGMVLSLAFLLLVSLIVSAALNAFDGAIDEWLPRGTGSIFLSLANFLITYILLTGLFSAMFKVLPDAEIRWRDVVIGAAGTAALFVLGKSAISLYLGSRNMATTYGAAGSLVLLLAWVYYSTLILLFGAEFTQVWAKRQGQEIRPGPGAVRLIKKIEPQS